MTQQEIQEVVDIEACLITWYRTITETRRSGVYPKVTVKYQPSGDQLREWLSTYGFAATEYAMHYGLINFLKKVNGVVETAKDAIYMRNYLNVCVKGTRGSFEKARISAEEEIKFRVASPFRPKEIAEGL